MKALVLLLLLALLTLSLCRRGMGHFRGVPGCGEGTYAVSWGEQRGSGRGFLSFGEGAAPAWNPLEAKREVCELNPDCDELADHIGFQEAYRRFYGPV
uniref:Osteocalcin n=2 Tax=Anas platyrhynchos TaxID=8839 RepID=A0A493TMM3_ANAPP